MRAVLIGLGLTLTLTTSPALAATSGQALEPLRVSPVRDGRLFVAEPSSLLQVPSTEIACGGQPIQPLYADDLAVGAVRSAAHERPAVVLTFSVDAQGRTRDIRPAPDGPSNPTGPIIIPQLNPAEAEQAALAAWRFQAAPRADCRATIRYSTKPLEAATTDDLLRYFAVTRTRGALRDIVARRLGGPGADCGSDGRGGRAARTISVPDFKIGRRPPPGGRSWTVVRWNVNAAGRATGVETLGSSGDIDLDREARRAVADTVLRPGAPLTGCVFNFNRIGDTLPAPDMPAPDQDPQQVCPADISDRLRLTVAPERFPAAFAKRRIEGWALIRFDLATWGQTGALEVIDAQPAATFGEDGRRMIGSARAEAAPTAAVRCVVPIRYLLPVAASGPEATRDDVATD
ncbi:MAG: energy transducer TonB [Candidatus Brevundimonas colombiensis]|uniref:Energy transducer TonB n=1 Tax=Candidatus Brevundimonas colombiensis TaxID=3121376 RepID=A0AAJ5X0L5_9CAUL|nr:energy transducer TonB [Brevundimonas sp.]WEK40255.1 MAG: energy transducer TonB [Brevundimonas sp.]